MTAPDGCVCPEWEHPYDYDGPEDFASACANAAETCPVHRAGGAE